MMWWKRCCCERDGYAVERKREGKTATLDRERSHHRPLARQHQQGEVVSKKLRGLTSKFKGYSSKR